MDNDAQKAKKMEDSTGGPKEDKDEEDNEQKSTDEDSSEYSYDEGWRSSEDNKHEQKKGDVQEYPTIKDKIYECETFAGFKIFEAYEGDKIKQGQRVVLNPDVVNITSDPKRRHSIGTVIRTGENKVLVLWDSENKPEEYTVQDTTGEHVKYNLLLLDNAQTGAKHEAYECDNCNEQPIRGIKWRCLYCKDFDLCTRCYMQDKHNINHPFHRKLSNHSRGIEVGNRLLDSKENNYKNVCGIFPGARVLLRSDNKTSGTVKELNNEEYKLFNCDAFVNWNETKSEERCRAGREGKVDLKCMTPGKGLRYYEEHLQIITSENAKPGMRVVAKYKKGKKEQYVGTVISNETEKDSKFEVQWDGGGEVKRIGKKTIFLYDNSQIGIEHGDIRCSECGRRIKGVRWKCENKDYDLCSRCYMSGKGEMMLRFCRMVDPSRREKLNQSRSALSSENKIQALGLFEGATVCKIESSNEKRQGTISKITDYKVDTGRNVVSVKWDCGDFPESGWKFTDLKVHDLSQTLSYYPAHLPKLQEDMHGYIKAGDSKTKIFVDFWYNESSPQSKEEKPLPFLLFASNPNKTIESEQDENENKIIQGRSRLLRNIRSVSEKAGLPCLDVVEKTLFFQEKVIIHQETTEGTIQMLVEMGEYAFERGDSKYKENEIKYFRRMIEANCGHVVLPVALSLDNGGFQKHIVENAVNMKFPILSSTKSTKDATVTLIDHYGDHHNKEEYSNVLLATKYLFNIDVPWKVKMEYDADVFRNDLNKLKDANEISFTDEMPHDLYDLDTIVCCTLIAVCMTERAQIKFKEKYANPLCMYLLKTGKWKIPKDCIKNFFSYRSIEYIFEKKMAEDFMNGLWVDLKEATNNVYQPPVWDGKELKTSISGLFGLIFLALLKGKFYTGAKQFIETGCVRIHFILVGCVILQEAVDDWRTSEEDKEKFELMIKKFTHQALRILSCVHEADKQNNAKTEAHEKKTKSITEEEKIELGTNIQHSGRLLLNHGYLTGGIQTENRIFLDNEVVKNILNQMWYGCEKVTKSKVLGFVLLAILHIVLLPCLMITLENKPLKWLYRQYKVPFMKVFLNVLSLFALLTGYAYMLLFDFDKGISNTDIFVIAWMTSFFIEEIKQVFVAVIRRKKKQYITDPWNILDWLSLTTYTCGMLMKLNDMYDYFTASKVLLVAAFIMLSIRILHMFSMSELLGPTLVIIQKMFRDTVAFMAIMFVITMCYNISYYAILYSENSEFSFDQLEKITRNGYWMLFGELNLEGDSLTEPDCTFNETEYRDGSQERCPSSLGRFLAPYLKAVYVFIAVILLLNLLIAMYSNTFAEVQEKSKFYWSQLQTDFLEEFSLKSIFPVHMQLLATPFFVIHAVVWMVKSIPQCCNSSVHAKDDKTIINHAPYTHEDDIKKMERIPMFVQGFIYDSSYDLKLKETREAEGQAALITKGEMDINEENKFKEMNRNMMTHRREIEKSIKEQLKELKSTLLAQLKQNDYRRSKSELSPNSSIKSRISSHASDLESDSDI